MARGELGEQPKLPAPADNFGFYEGDDAALENFIMLKRYGILPRGGGWQDQSDQHRADLLTVQHEYNLILARLIREQERRRQ
jgi:hypothetical protein